MAQEYGTVHITQEMRFEIVLIKVLRYTLEDAPDLPPTSDGILHGQASIIRDIEQCTSRRDLSALARLYYDTLLVPSK